MGTWLVATAVAAPEAFWVRVDDPTHLPPDALWTEETRTGPAGREWRVLVPSPSTLAGWPAVPAPAPPIPAGWPGPDAVADRVHAAIGRAARGEVVTLGWSTGGDEILGAWLGRPPGAGPASRLLGGHHGDELPAVALALDVLEHLVDADGADPAVTAALDAGTVWVVPCVNPDGLRAGTRTSATDVDLNRNYGYGWRPGVWAGPSPFSEPETRAIRGLADRARPVISLSLHAGAENLGWPWNYTTAEPPDARTFTTLAARYAERTGRPDFWTTQGSAWYRTFGDTNDWAYGRFGVLDLTVEVSVDKAPPPEDLAAIRATHLEALVDALTAPPARTGRVLDPEGHPLEARLHAPGTADTWTDPVTGFWARHTAVGPLTVEAPGFVPASTTGGDVVLTPAPTRPRPVLALRAPRRVDFGGPVVLTRPGEAPVPVGAAPGGALLDPARLAPGAWTVEAADGTISPRAVLVEDRGDAAVSGWSFTPEGVRIDGRGFGEGARAVGVRGTWLEPLPVRRVATGLEVVGAPPLLVHAGGAVLAITRDDDGGARATTDDEALLVAGGCATAPIRWNLTAVAVSVAVAGARRRGARRSRDRVVVGRMCGDDPGGGPRAPL
jgi:hypothetical protein